MDPRNLSRFDIEYPGIRIAGDDRDLAFETAHLLSLVESQFIRAVAAYSLFKPITEESIKERIDRQLSKYQACLNSIYATSFVLSLDTIAKLLHALLKYLDPPPQARSLVEKYQDHFKHLRHIRDSILHIEDRGRGKDRHQKRIPANLLVLGVYIKNRFQYTGADGCMHSVEISETTLYSAHEIIQAIINSYKWE